MPKRTTQFSSVKETLCFLEKDMGVEARFLLASVLETESLADRLLSEGEKTVLRACLQRYEKGEPLAYIIGSVGFWTFDRLKVRPGVLIPRPDSECLVDCVLEACSSHALSVLELGTGTGALALALACERPSWTIMATDKSQKALELAQENSALLGVGKEILWCLSDWFEKLEGQYDCILSNPPYVDETDPCLDKTALSFEPREALYSMNDGYADLFLIVSQARDFLKPGGRLFLEHGYQQGPRLRQYLQEQGYSSVSTACDLGGHERVSGGIVGDEDRKNLKRIPVQSFCVD
jgi:release factor glutamine methyltransferase